MNNFLLIKSIYYYIVQIFLLLPLCGCSTANFPDVGLIKDYFILNYVSYQQPNIE